jgi:capsular polysaccharide export protein
VVTEHPLDLGVVNLESITRSLATKAGVGERVLYLRGGSSNELVRGSRGLITVNSTMGILGLTFGVPVIALGHAIYDMPGLTFQGGLDDFWAQRKAPDASAFDAFRRVVAARTQLNGGFYSKMGLALAVDGAVSRLQAAVKDDLGRAFAGAAADSRPVDSRLPELKRGLATQAWDGSEAIPE